MFKKILSTFFVRITISLINLFTVILISQCTGAQGKGEVSLIVTSIALIIMFCNIVGGDALVYLVPRHNLAQLIVTSNLWSLICCLAAYFILYFFQLIPNAYLIHIILLALLNAFLATNLTVLLGKEKVNSNNLISLILTLVTFSLLLILFFALHQKNTFSYIYSLYVAYALCILISTLLIRPFINSFSFENIFEVFSKSMDVGWKNQLGHITQFVSLRVSYYVLNEVVNESAVGVYSNASSVVEAVWLISNSFAMIQYARVSNSTDVQYNKTLTLDMVRYNTIICSLVLLLMFLLPSGFYTLLFGAEFSDMKKLIMILSPGILLYSITLIVNHYYSGIGKYGVNTSGNVVGMLVTLLFTCIFLLGSYNSSSAALISSISYASTSFFIIAYFIRDTKYKIGVFIPRKADFKELVTKLKSLRQA